MDIEKKLSFLQNMAHMALTHAASSPNVPTPSGGMSHDKMLSFVSGIASKGLQHFDDGGLALNGPTTPGAGSDPSLGSHNALGSLLGTSNNFQATGAPIQAGTNTAQLNNSFNGVQGALGQQQNLSGQLNPGVGQGIASQNNLTNMYTAQANGQGANPALARLNQATGQNIQQQAALQAGQRGAGANAGLIARQNAQQGAMIQQNAAGQAATMTAEQQLAAENNLQNLAATQVNQGAGAIQGLNNAQQNEQNILQGSNTNFNNANVTSQGNINNVNAGVAAANQQNSGSIVSGIGNAIGSAAGAVGGLFGFADGGEVTKAPMIRKPVKMAEGGIAGQQVNGPQSFAGQWLSSSVPQSAPQIMATPSYGSGAIPAIAMPEQGDKEEEEVSSAKRPLDSASDVGDNVMMAKDGGKVPGKAPINHDDLKNDTVPAMLTKGEVVMDLDTLNDKGPVGQMARAVAAHIQARNKSKK